MGFERGGKSESEHHLRSKQWQKQRTKKRELAKLGKTGIVKRHPILSQSESLERRGISREMSKLNLCKKKNSYVYGSVRNIPGLEYACCQGGFLLSDYF